MTFEEKLAMYRGKKKFIEDISTVFKNNPTTHSVEDITYEVYTKEFNCELWYDEWLVVHFKGGSISPRFVSGNSNVANLRAISDMIDGGWYREVDAYRALTEHGFEKLELA